MSRVSTDDPVSSVCGLLDDGAWLLARSQRTLDESAKLAEEARALILTFRSHRFRPIVGAHDLDHERERIRHGLRAFASFGIAKTSVGPSRGAACHACGSNIPVGEIEYELVALNGNEVRLNSACYLVLMNDLGTLPQAPDADAAN